MQRTELIDEKIASAVEGLNPEFRTHFSKISTVNILSLADYLESMKSEVNPSDNYRKNIIHIVSTLSRFHKNKLSFKTMVKKDIIAFLNHLRKPDNIDPQHKWIGTYNLYITVLIKFFKWLYNPGMSPKTRPKPAAVENIPQLKRKEISTYSPDDLWTLADDEIFLRYCPTKRIKAYHTVARDTSCRPHELLKLKVSEIIWKLTPDKKQYAEISLNGKTGKRHIPLFHSIPYVKDYLDHEHPSPNPNAPFICGLGKGLGKRIGVDGLRAIYVKLQTEYFRKLLQTDIPQEDKDKIIKLLRKPWNPYIRRHTGLTEKSLKIPALMNQYAGWTPNSKMSQKYFHYFGNESSNGLLEAYGYVSKDSEESAVLKPKQCPNCAEPNKPDSRFCATCRMVLTYDAYNETIEQKQEKDKQIEVLMEKQERFEQMLQSLIDSGQLKPANLARQGTTNTSSHQEP